MEEIFSLDVEKRARIPFIGKEFIDCFAETLTHRNETARPDANDSTFSVNWFSISLQRCAEKRMSHGTLASFVQWSSAPVNNDQLPDDLATAYFAQARTALADELAALLARFAKFLRDGIDPVTALRQYLLPDPRFGPLTFT